jgi:hypothetical protein
MTKPDPLFSAGARLERASFRAYLKNQIDKWNRSGNIGRAGTFQTVLKWVQGRQKRYDKKPGGLGK